MLDESGTTIIGSFLSLEISGSLTVADTKPKKKRVIKKSETVRQQRDKAALQQPKKRHVRAAAKKATSPFRVLVEFIGKLLRPFRFLLWPFKTRPARFVGRILAKIFFINYIRSSWAEVRLVEWPNRRDTAKLTLAVIVFATVFGGLVTILDFILDKVFKQILT